MKRLGYTQSNYLVDVRLGLGFASVAIAAATAAWDYYAGFFEAFNFTAVGLVLYALLNGAYALWVWKVEAGTVYSGGSATETIEIKSEVPDKFEPRYRLKIKITDKKTNKVTELSNDAEFMGWFGINGLIVLKKFEEFVKASVQGSLAGETKKVR